MQGPLFFSLCCVVESRSSCLVGRRQRALMTRIMPGLGTQHRNDAEYRRAERILRMRVELACISPISPIEETPPSERPCEDLPSTYESFPRVSTPISKPEDACKIHLPARVDYPMKTLEYQGFDDTVRPGIWNFDAHQFGHIDKPTCLDIAEQIMMKAQLDDNEYSGSYDTGDYESGSYKAGSYETRSYKTGSYDSGSYETGSYETGSDESGSCFYESQSEISTPEEPPKRENRLMRFWRRIKNFFS